MNFFFAKVAESFLKKLINLCRCWVNQNSHQWQGSSFHGTYKFHVLIPCQIGLKFSIPPLSTMHQMREKSYYLLAGCLEYRDGILGTQ
jgi:hypothetical protein